MYREGDLVSTSATSLIARVDLADLASEVGVPFPLSPPSVHPF